MMFQQRPYTYRSLLLVCCATTSSISQPGTWGDHVTLQAAANACNVQICVLSSFLDSCVISIHPCQSQQQQESAGEKPVSRIVWLAFWAEVSSTPTLLCACLSTAAYSTTDQHAVTKCERDNDQAAWSICTHVLDVVPSLIPQVHYNSLAAKAPASPSASLSDSSPTSSTDTADNSRRLLGSKKLGKAAAILF